MTPYEQYCACTTLEELQEVKPLLESEAKARQDLYDEYKAKEVEYREKMIEQGKLLLNVAELIKVKGYEISFPEG